MQNRSEINNYVGHDNEGKINACVITNELINGFVTDILCSRSTPEFLLHLGNLKSTLIHQKIQLVYIYNRLSYLKRTFFVKIIHTSTKTSSNAFILNNTAFLISFQQINIMIVSMTAVTMPKTVQKSSEDHRIITAKSMQSITQLKYTKQHFKLA